VKSHRDRTLAPEIRAVLVDVDGEPYRHHRKVHNGQYAQRFRGARIRTCELSTSNAPIPRDHGHEHENRDLCWQQHGVRHQSRIPGVHVRQPCRRD